MKNICCSTLLLLFALTAATKAESLVKGEWTQAASNVRQLSLAIAFYNEKSTSGAIPNVSGPFPNDLHDLVEAAILTQSDFEKLTKKFKIHYFKPSLAVNDPNLPIIFTRCDDNTIFGFTDGRIERYADPKLNSSSAPIIIGVLTFFASALVFVAFTHKKAEQGAAANP